MDIGGDRFKMRPVQAGWARHAGRAAMKSQYGRRLLSATAIALALVPAPSNAIAPVILALAKQFVQQALQSTLKDMLLGSLRDSGCKGTALANALSAFDMRSAGMRLPAGMPALAGGMPSLPGGMPSLPGGGAGLALPQAGGALAGGASGMLPGDMAGMLPGGMAGMLPGGAGALGGVDPAVMAAMMERMAPGGVAGLPAMDPALMTQAQQLMSQPPLSPTETLATIDELGELGFLPPAMRAELKECMVVLPQTAAALGMGMSMLKPMLPQLREARTEMQALSPSEQDELAAAMASELKSISGDDRKLFLEQLGSGFFPPRVAEGVRQRLGAK